MGAFVDIGPVHTYYDDVGDGEPLVLLHGGLDSNAAWGAQREVLRDHFRVVAPERRGHGHTADVPGPLTFEVMAEDLVGFLERVVGAPAHLVGWSDGAVVAMLVAIGRPDLVNRLVLVGGNAEQSGITVSLQGPDPGDTEHPVPNHPMFEPLRHVYEAVSPDGPDHWPEFFTKVTTMWQSGPHIPLEDLGRIEARTLVLVGDDDVVALEHTVAMFRAIPRAELAVVPGTSHVALMEKPHLCNALLLDFLLHEPVVELLPVRRAA